MREAWTFKPHSNKSHAFSHLIVRTRANLISWKKIGLNSIDSELRKIEHAISEAEVTKDLNNTSTITYTGLTTVYNKLSAL